MTTTYICPAIAFKNEDGFNIYCDVQTFMLYGCECTMYVYMSKNNKRAFKLQEDFCVNNTCVARVVFTQEPTNPHTLYIGKHYNYDLSFYKSFCWFLSCFNLSDFEDTVKGFMHNFKSCDTVGVYKLRRCTSAADVESFEFGNYKCLI